LSRHAGRVGGGGCGMRLSFSDLRWSFQSESTGGGELAEDGDEALIKRLEVEFSVRVDRRGRVGRGQG
jgi:hypothetical protein